VLHANLEHLPPAPTALLVPFAPLVKLLLDSKAQTAPHVLLGHLPQTLVRFHANLASSADMETRPKPLSAMTVPLGPTKARQAS